MRYTYKTRGVCARTIEFDLVNDIVTNIVFNGGCNGNGKGVASLAEGMTTAEITNRLTGIKCGMRPTSCPDQLTKAVNAAKRGEI